MPRLQVGPEVVIALIIAAALVPLVAWDIGRRYLLVRAAEVSATRAGADVLERITKCEEGLRELRTNQAMRGVR